MQPGALIQVTIDCMVRTSDRVIKALNNKEMCFVVGVNKDCTQFNVLCRYGLVLMSYVEITERTWNV